LNPGQQAQVPDSAVFYRQVNTYVNPVLGGDHPDPTLFKDGDDFYMCGSCFHFTPYLPILHSKDLVHWEEICRVVSPGWKELAADRPSGGIWQGAITYFYGSYWIYFSNGNSGGQYFCKSNSPAGPWSEPVKVKTTPTTGSIGYDNSIFVDDDGTPYMLTKSGKPINRIQQIGRDGHLTGDAINIDWINANERYSWAEGPVMCKRNGWYYYTFARDVAGGQFIYRTRTLTSDSTKWEALGNFFSPITDPATGFRVSNHMSAPIQLKDGTWWAIAQSYDKVGSHDWSGQGRQTLLHQINWDENGRPFGVPSSSLPQRKPDLPKSGLSWVLPRTDHFDAGKLKLSWHFLNRAASHKYSLTDKKGWIRLKGDSSSAHLLQKEGGHYYALVTRVELDASKTGEEAGLYLTNGNRRVTGKLVTTFNDGKKIELSLGNASFKIPNTIGNTVWLKLERREHQLKGFVSSDGTHWNAVGNEVDATVIDREQPNFNSWVGTSIGLFAAPGTTADFDFFLYRDGFAETPVAGYNNYFGIENVPGSNGIAVTNSSSLGGWLMLGGIDLGWSNRKAQEIKINAAVAASGKIEIWLDDIEGDGRLIGTISLKPAGSPGQYDTYGAKVKNVAGQHDVYLRFTGQRHAFNIKSIQFVGKR
jgi:beta-xylosidase